MLWADMECFLTVMRVRCSSNSINISRSVLLSRADRVASTAKITFGSQAIECFIGATEINPKDASTYSKLGLNYGKNGQLDLAMQAFDTALALDPNHAMARSNKAVALERMGKQEVSEYRPSALPELMAFTP
jgi:lipoprotein NlpI